jgi:DNA-directed RNA polymerase subunit RPC12/RpoP
VELPTTDNGVPEGEKSDTHSCFINQSRVESIRNLVYYQQDSGFELELSGYRCTACGAVVSEEGRKKNKLGGANGSGIAKAKCPKCSGKMGEDKLFRLKKTGEKPAAE